MRAKSDVNLRLSLLLSAAMLFGCAGTSRDAPVTKSVLVCAAGNCGPTEERYSNGQLLTALHQLLVANDGLEYKLCEADQKSLHCVAESVGHVVFAMLVPGPGTQSSGTIRNPRLDFCERTIRMSKSDPKLFFGTPVTCSDHGTSISMSPRGQMLLTDIPYSCNWAVVGVMTAKSSFAIESIDLDKGRIAGSWSHELTGTGNGSGKGFAAIQFQKAMPRGENWLQPASAGLAGGAVRAPNAIAGAVRDAEGGRFPGVKVTLTGKAGSKAVSAGACGVYQFAELEPGSYRVSTTAPNYQTETRDIRIPTRGQSMTDIVLCPATRRSGAASLAHLFNTMDQEDPEQFARQFNEASGRDVSTLTRGFNTGDARDVTFTFFEAVREGHLPRVRQQVSDNPALLNEKDVRFGRTALHWAVLHGSEAVARFLVTQGAEAGITDCEGKTALQEAERSGKLEMVRILR